MVKAQWSNYLLPQLSHHQSTTIAEEIYNSLKERRSCRSFSSAEVSKRVIELAIMAAGTAPSGANHQPWHFAVVGNHDTKRVIREAAEEEEKKFYGFKDDQPRANKEWLEALAPLGTNHEKEFLEQAPYLIIVFSQRKGGIEEDGKRQNYYVTESVGIACGMLLTTLHMAGLATLTHTPSPMGFLRQICGRPNFERPMMIIAVGRPSDDAKIPTHAKRKKSLKQITSWL